MGFYGIQPSFAGGELSAALYGRVDMAKYSVGLARCRNAFVHAYGGVSNRPGTEFVSEVKDSSKRVRLTFFSIARRPPMFWSSATVIFVFIPTVIGLRAAAFRWRSPRPIRRRCFRS